MSVSESNRTSISNYEILFRKSSYQSNWDEKSPERSSIISLSPDEIGVQIHPREQFGNVSSADSQIVSPSTNFLPTMVRFEQRVSFKPTSASISACTADSLEESAENTVENEIVGEQTVVEEDSLNGTQTTNLDLEDEEGCVKEDNNPVDYLDKEVFPVLLPCLEKMLFAAKENDVLKVQKSRFNGLDYLAELLWNRNPRHPERHHTHVPVFDIPFVQKHLEEYPRPIIPRSWLWSRDEAAVVLQSAIRGYLVRCQPHVQELRQFWKMLAEEKNVKKPKTVVEKSLRVEESSRIEPSPSNFSFFS